MNYTIELPILEQYFDNFKQKNASILITAFSLSGIGEHLGKVEYGSVTFADNDISHKYAIYEGLPEFNRNKTNAILFHLNKVDNWPHPYDNLILYTTNGKDGSYGFAMFSEDTKYIVQIPAIENEYDELIKSVKTTFNSMLTTCKEAN